MEKYKLLKYRNENEESSEVSFNIPIFLDSKIDEMGVMVGFDGDIEQIDQLNNFVYTSIGRTVTIENTTNTDKFRKKIEQNFTVNWGDGTLSTLSLNGIISHTYSEDGIYEIKVTLDTPWTNEVIRKTINIPLFDPEVDEIENILGTFTTVDIPSYEHMTGQTINYINDLDYTNNTGHTTFTYVGVGGSRLEELKKYGEDEYEGLTFGEDNIGTYTGYTFEYMNDDQTMILHYQDYNDGVTMITGSTIGFHKEEIFETMLTRNEHFLGFIDDPSVFSDVFVERGKQGVMEKNLRLSEIDNIGELTIYGNGFFKIRKQ
jgi:hypothetical protein